VKKVVWILGILAGLAFSQGALAQAQVSANEARAMSFSGGSYRLTLFNFAYGTMTLTPAMLLNPPINSDRVRIYSPNCQGLVTAFAKTNVPAFGFYTMNPMSPVGSNTWAYSSKPIRAIQVGLQQTQFYPWAQSCDLVIEPVGRGGNPGGGGTCSEGCLSISEGNQLQRCQNQGSSSLACELLELRYRRHGLCR
jgi:hypothetical protein